MPQYVISPQPQPAVSVAGSDALFPVRRIFCVGRNYAAHAREMGFSDAEAPFFFMKPADSLVSNGETIPYPTLTKNLQHEIELVLAIGKDGNAIAPEVAFDHIYGVGVGIDLTRRDIQIAHREKGRPWDWGKGFDHSAPISAITPMAALPEERQSLDQGRIWLAVNGEIRQDGDLSEHIWGVRQIIAFCSDSVRLKAGDLIFTGTPSGVSAIEAGDVITGGIDGIGEISVTIKSD